MLLLFIVLLYCYLLAVVQDHMNKNKRNLQLLILEKKVDDILQHWRSRIGLEKKQVVSMQLFPLHH
jgi:hypothetical protein